MTLTMLLTNFTSTNLHSLSVCVIKLKYVNIINYIFV